MAGKGGSRPGAGRKKKTAPVAIGDRGYFARLIEQLEGPASENEPIDVAGWRGLWNALDARIRLDTRKYCYDQRDGKARNTVNHLHDKPIEHNHTISIRGTLEKAMQRALKR